MRWTGQIKFAVDVPLHVCYRKPAVKKKNGGVVHLGSNYHDLSDMIEIFEFHNLTTYLLLRFTENETKEKKVGKKEFENYNASAVTDALTSASIK